MPQRFCGPSGGDRRRRRGGSNNVIIRNVKVDTSANGTVSNGDGTDPDSCTNCLIDNVNYATSDDNIAIKSGLNEDGIAVGKPSHNIVIRGVTSTTGHGGITIGSEMSGGVHNVYATGDTFMVGVGSNPHQDGEWARRNHREPVVQESDGGLDQ